MMQMKWLALVLLLARGTAAATKPICNDENQDLCHTGATTNNDHKKNPSHGAAEIRQNENPMDGIDQEWEDDEEEYDEDEDYDEYYDEDDEDYDENDDEDDDDEEEEEDGYVYDYDHDYDWEQYDACRLHPTWVGPGVDFDTCQAVTEYYPRDKWWRRDTDFATMQTGEGTLELIQECLDQALMEREARQEVETADIEAFSSYSHDENGDVVIVHNILSDQEAYALMALQQCVNLTLGHDSKFHRDRAFETGDKKKGMYDSGSNYCTYLGGLLQTFLPGVAASIYHAARAAYDYEWEWNEYPPPEALGLRTADVMKYRHNDGLGTRHDLGSIFTITINLSEPDDFEGDDVYLRSEDALLKVNRLSGIVFFSGSSHGGTKVLDGHSTVFSAELWDQDDAPIGLPRPTYKGMLDYVEDRAPLVNERIAVI